MTSLTIKNYTFNTIFSNQFQLLFNWLSSIKQVWFKYNTLIIKSIKLLVVH